DGDTVCFTLTTQNVGDQAYLTSATSSSVSGSFLVDPSEQGGSAITSQNCKDTPFSKAPQSNLGRVNSAVPIAVRSDANKSIVMYYTPAKCTPQNGQCTAAPHPPNAPLVIDTITAGNAPSNPSVKVSTSFS